MKKRAKNKEQIIFVNTCAELIYIYWLSSSKNILCLRFPTLETNPLNKRYRYAPNKYLNICSYYNNVLIYIKPEVCQVIIVVIVILY